MKVVIYTNTSIVGYTVLLCRDFLVRKDIGIVLITQSVAEMVRHIIDSHREAIPSILEIPSKEAQYDPNKVCICSNIFFFNFYLFFSFK